MRWFKPDVPTLHHRSAGVADRVADKALRNKRKYRKIAM